MLLRRATCRFALNGATSNTFPSKQIPWKSTVHRLKNARKVTLCRAHTGNTGVTQSTRRASTVVTKPGGEHSTLLRGRGAGEKIVAGRRASLDSTSRPVAIWLFSTAGAVAVMVTVGGITRMTKSGLSMTDWKLQGTLPPITQVGHFHSPFPAHCGIGIDETHNCLLSRRYSPWHQSWRAVFAALANETRRRRGLGGETMLSQELDFPTTDRSPGA